MARRIGLAVGALLLVVVALVLVFAATFDANRYRGDIATRAKQWTGRTLSIDGDLDLAFLPLRIVLHDARFENAPGASRPEMATIERLDLGIALGALVFERRLVVDHLRLSGVDLLLERDQDGRGNWQLAPDVPTASSSSDTSTVAPDQTRASGSTDEQSERGARATRDTTPAAAGGVEDRTGAATNAASFALPDLREVTLERVTVRMRDPGAERETTAVVDRLMLEPRDGSLGLDLSARLRDAPITVTGTLGALDALDGHRGPWPLRLSGDADGTRVELDGTIARPLSGEGVALRFAANGSNLAALSKFAGAALPATRPWSLDGRITQPAADRYALDELMLVVGGSSVAGSAKIKRAERPRIEATLTSPLFDLDDFTQADAPPAQGAHHADTPGSSALAALPLARDAADDAPQTPRDSVVSIPRTSGSGGSRGAGGRLVPDVALPFDALGRADASITFTVAKLAVARLPFDEVAAHLGLENGALDVTLERVGLLGGKLDGALDLDARERTTRLRLRGHALPLGRLLEVTEISNSLREAESTLDLELHGSGATTHALISSLDGLARVDVTEGRISNRVFDLLNGDVLSLLKPLLAGDSETRLRCAVTRFDVSGGVARSRVLAVDATRFTVSGAGSVDLGRETVSIDLEPRSRDASLAGVVVPLRIRGALAAPSVKADAAGAIGAIAGSEVVARLREKTGFDLSQLGRALSGEVDDGNRVNRELSCEQARAIAAGRAAARTDTVDRAAPSRERSTDATPPARTEKPLERLRDNLRNLFGR